MSRAIHGRKLSRVFIQTLRWKMTSNWGKRRLEKSWLLVIHQKLSVRFLHRRLHYTYLPTPWCRVLLQKLTGLQLVKKFPAFHGTRRFITALTSVRHLSLSWASPIQSMYRHPIFWRSILILSTHLRLGLPSGLFPFSFPTNTLYTPLSSHIRATCPAQLILLDFITRTILGEEYKTFSSSLCSLLHSPVTSSLLGPNILLNTMFSNTLSIFSYSQTPSTFFLNLRKSYLRITHRNRPRQFSVPFFVS